VISRHNEIRDELVDLASKALTPFAVRDKPRIHTSCPAEPVRTSDQNPVIRNLHKRQGEERGDVLIRGLWQQGTDAIIDVCITNLLDAKSNISQAPMKVLAAHKREKKRKYLEPCLEQRRHFSPFVVSTDGLIGKEAQTMLKKLSARLAEKSGKPYSVVCEYVKARMSIAIVRATHLCLRGSRVPTSQMSNCRPQWEYGAGLGLFRRKNLEQQKLVRIKSIEPSTTHCMTMFMPNVPHRGRQSCQGATARSPSFLTLPVIAR
jgi:hypothetical protein